MADGAFGMTEALARETAPVWAKVKDHVTPMEWPAQAALISETRGEPPLLLLDDVLSELDRDRRTRLIELGRQHGQVILTATGADGVDDLADLVHTLEVLV